MNRSFDVAVIGAGPAGAVAATVLARAGRRVLLVDGSPKRQRTVGESLPAAARPLLRDLDLLSVVEKGPHLSSFGNTSAWGSQDLASTDFIRDPNGLGWHLDRVQFDLDLRNAARTAGADCFIGRARDFTPIDDGWRLRLASTEIEARWIIDATGRGATVARRLGAIRHRDDDLVALYRWAVTPKEDVDTRTLVEASTDGWWYTSKLPDATRIAVFHTNAKTAAAIQHQDGAWDDYLASTTPVRQALEHASYISTPRAREACGARLDHFIGHRWLAAGDAALAFDPLSSQGIFNALYSGMKAGQAAQAALAGDTNTIKNYAARLEAIRAAYLNHHRLVYAAERRWLHRPFWEPRSLGGINL